MQKLLITQEHYHAILTLLIAETPTRDISRAVALPKEIVDRIVSLARHPEMPEITQRLAQKVIDMPDAAWYDRRDTWMQTTSRTIPTIAATIQETRVPPSPGQKRKAKKP